jgi:hypothetical protein
MFPMAKLSEVNRIKPVRICMDEIDSFLARELESEQVLKLLERDLLERQPELKVGGTGDRREACSEGQKDGL